MRERFRQRVTLAFRSKRIWLLPIILFLVIIALLVIDASRSPAPVFIYPLV